MCDGGTPRHLWGGGVDRQSMLSFVVTNWSFKGSAHLIVCT